MAPVVTTTCITLISNKIQNRDISVSANPGPPGKMAVKMDRERERETDRQRERQRELSAVWL